MENTPYSAHSNSSAGATVDKMTDAATDKLSSVLNQTEQLAHRLAEQSQLAAAQMQEVGGNLKGAVDKSVKDQPNATLAMAAAIGFVLGAIWKS
jgi:ElaB/YqjD/DUF883 family membrane-anchored ribosome-binding protein